MNTIKYIALVLVAICVNTYVNAFQTSLDVIAHVSDMVVWHRKQEFEGMQESLKERGIKNVGEYIDALRNLNQGTLPLSQDTKREVVQYVCEHYRNYGLARQAVRDVAFCLKLYNVSVQDMHSQIMQKCGRPSTYRRACFQRKRRRQD